MVEVQNERERDIGLFGIWSVQQEIRIMLVAQVLYHEMNAIVDNCPP
jgi:hypothetical protein